MFINVHMGPSQDQEQRFDTLISPSGTIATLLKIQEELGITDRVGIDESFPGEEATKRKIDELLHASISGGDKPTILFTMLIYNAERSIRYIRQLKEQHGDKIRVAVGGQLVPLAEQAYVNNRDIDVVCVGDAEQILPRLIADIAEGNTASKYEGWVKHTAEKRFAGVSYEHYWQISERMAEQKRLAGFSQLTVQGPGGPGCSWAANNKEGACQFCALQNIVVMNQTPLQTSLANEAQVAQTLHPDRFFDVANQFLPYLDKRRNKEWLQQYADIRSELGITANKYAYLTVSSIDAEIAILLKRIGLNEAYLGVDHFHPEALAEENKPFRRREQLERTLDTLAAEGISWRSGIVLGSAHESQATLQAVREGVDWMLRKYGDRVHAIGVFPVEVIPGSKVFKEMQQSGEQQQIFAHFARDGYMTREDQRQLTRTFVEYRSDVKFEQIQELEGEIARMATEAGVREYTVDELHASEHRGDLVPPSGGVSPEMRG